LSEPLEETLRRLKQERDDADRAYNDALTALDQATLRRPEPFPHVPPPYDEHQIALLNQAWNIVAAPPAGSGLRGRLAGFVWHIVAPSLQKQQAFNSAVVDRVNRNAAAHRDAQRAIETTIALIGQMLEQLSAFQSRLIQYVQQITLYVDTRDRATAGQDLVVNAAVNGLGDNFARRWESLLAREQRIDARVASLVAAHEEIRTLVGIAQQASLVAKREVERLGSLGNSQLPTPKATAAATTASAPDAFGRPLDAYKYVGFEDQFRGSQDAIRARFESYLPIFEGASDVLDVGCGRGEFLDLLQTRGVSARGLDLNPEMVEVCRARGLAVEHADVVTYLAAQPDQSLGGLFAAQVVEHLEAGYLLGFLEVAQQKLRPGSAIVLETLNPACWVAFFDSFIRDITHVRPLHPDTLRYLVLASGFTSANIEFRSPVRPADRLQPVASAPGSALADLVDTFNANVEKLNARMFTYLDYAIVGRRS
jgi:SAM-dependent methyltransferase